MTALRHVLHEDADLLVLDKPAGLLCVPGRGDDKQDCLSARAQRQWPDALVVHRLDMATSGIVVMARSPAVQRALGDAFARRDVHKQYEAIVDGALPASGDWAIIDAPLIADWPRRPLQKIDAAGRPSLTRWRVLQPLPALNASHVLLQPLTGRSHQLRVHMMSIGHAILGDALYASDTVQARAPRLMLHASRLAFTHPVTRQRLEIASPAPFGAFLSPPRAVVSPSPPAPASARPATRAA